MRETRWRKSSYSGGSTEGECVEVAVAVDQVGVRDTKDRPGGQLTLPRTSWDAFKDRLMGNLHDA